MATLQQEDSDASPTYAAVFNKPVIHDLKNSPETENIKITSAQRNSLMSRDGVRDLSRAAQ